MTSNQGARQDRIEPSRQALNQVSRGDLLAEMLLAVIAHEIAGAGVEAPVALGAVIVPFRRPGLRPISGGNRRICGWWWGRCVDVRIHIDGRGKGAADGCTDAEADEAGAPIAGAAPSTAAIVTMTAPTMSAPAAAGFGGEREGRGRSSPRERQGRGPSEMFSSSRFVLRQIGAPRSSRGRDRFVRGLGRTS